MGRVRHKRKKSHLVIVTSNAVDAGVRQFRIPSWVWRASVVVLCIIIGAILGYFIYEKDIWLAELQQTAKWQDAVDVLQQEKAELEQQIADLNGVIEQRDELIQGKDEEIAGLNEKIQILSETVAQKVQSESELKEQLEKQYLPTEFPLTGAATMEEAAEGDPMCVFTATAGAMVVATARGTILAVNEDAEYGHNVWVDHGNGYVTVYRNQGEAKVKQGETVTQGTTLFLIEEENSKLGYQMMKDGVYINPMDMLAISG